MFQNLSHKLQGTFEQLGRRGKLSEADVDSALREVVRFIDALQVAEVGEEQLEFLHY